MNPGFPTMIPRLVVSDLVVAVAFPRTVFGAAGDAEAGPPAELCR
jgi:PhnB protein